MYSNQIPPLKEELEAGNEEVAEGGGALVEAVEGAAGRDLR